MKAYGGLVDIAENVATKDWKHLPQSPKYDPDTPDRARPENVKEQIVAARGYENKRLAAEWVTEVMYSPTDCRETYRLVIMCKELEVTKQGRLFEDCVYFFYLTNESSDQLTTSEVVYDSNARCDQPINNFWHFGSVESVPSVARAAQQFGIELGVYGDDRFELELEGLDRT